MSSYNVYRVRYVISKQTHVYLSNLTRKTKQEITNTTFIVQTKKGKTPQLLDCMLYLYVTIVFCL